MTAESSAVSTQAQTGESQVGWAQRLGQQARTSVLQGVITTGIGVQHLRGDRIAGLLLPAGRRDPYPAYRVLREAGPLVPTMIGMASAEHAIVDLVLRDPERFGSAPVTAQPRPLTLLGKVVLRLRGGDGQVSMNGRRINAPGMFDAYPDPLGHESMIGMDPPDHTRLRRLVSRAFTPRAIAQVRDRVEEVAAELLDQAPRRDFELMNGFAGVLPVLVISELLGIPTEDRARVKHWGDVLASGLDVMGGAPAHVVAPALHGLGDYLTELFEARRRDPGERVIDTLIADADDEAGLTRRELMTTAMLLLVAGFETTVNLIGNAVLAMSEHPDQFALLGRRPELAGSAVEEVLRYDSPVQLTSRLVRQDTELAGRRLRRGVALILALGGANRDPGVFPEPDRFDITRENSRDHLAFVTGVHHCLGAALARLEGEVALSLLAERFDRITLAAKPVRGRGIILRGPRVLRVNLEGRG